MKTIKAEQLKWANMAITVHFNGSEVSLKSLTDDGNLRGHMYGGGSVEILSSWDVQVDPEQYTNAVIESIKGMISGVVRIGKRGGWLYADVRGFNLRARIDIKADPQPWLEEYRIEVDQ